MFCPKCHEKLVEGEPRKFETLSEHVSNPNMESYPLRITYVCKNPNCECSKDDVFWNETGDYYGMGNIEFEDDKYSAYPSFARRMEIEIYNKGLKKRTYLHPALTLWVLKPVIEYNYKADNNGNVVSKSWSLKWLKKDCWYKRDKLGYHTYYSFPIMTIIRHQIYFKEIFNNNELSNGFKNSQIKEFFKPLPTWDKRWWRHVELWLTKVIFRKHYLKYLENEKT